MKLLLTSISFFILNLTVLGQTYQERFNAVFFNDTVDVEKVVPILRAWEAAQPKDAEMLIAHSNYYFTIAQEEQMQLTTEPPTQGEQALEITDDEGNVEGYLRSVLGYNDSLSAIAIGYLNEALEYHPRRLDIWFGKCYTLREIGEYEAHVETLKAVLALNEEDPDSWLWANGDAFDQSRYDFYTSIHEYCSALATSDAPMNLIIDAIETSINYFPEGTELINDLGVAYFYAGDNTSAIDAFKRALATNEGDMTCISNIAYIYLIEGKLQESRSYYELLLKSDNPDDVAVAEEQLTYIQNLESE